MTDRQSQAICDSIRRRINDLQEQLQQRKVDVLNQIKYAKDGDRMRMLRTHMKNDGLISRISNHPTLLFGLTVVLLLMLGWVDYVTGYELGFFVFYFIPVTIAAWFLPRSAALIIVLASTLLWFGVDLLSGRPYTWWFSRYWDASIRGAAFVLMALILRTIRGLLARERQLNVEIAQALSEIQQLRGLLPICASCKRIRDDAGYWEQIEIYLEHHLPVAFSHSLCPTCSRALYPDLYADAAVQPEDL